MTVVLSKQGRTFASRPRAREVFGEAPASPGASAVTIDASDVYMSPSFIAETLVILVKEMGFRRVVVRGAREHPAQVTQHLAEKFGFADRVKVEQPALPTT